MCLVFVSTAHKNGARPFFALFFGFFRSVQRFEVFFELVVTLIAFDKKGNAVPVQSGLRFFDLRRKRTHDIIPKHVYMR